MMKFFNLIFVFFLIFTFISSCERPDLTEDVEWAYDYAERNSSSSSSDSGSGFGSCTTIDGNMWSSRSSSEMDWDDAGSYCNGLNECGYSDWRLPNINELRTLIKNCPGSQTGGSCAVSDPNHLASSDQGDNCYCDYKENNGGYYSKLGDDDNVSLWSSSVLSGYSDNALGVSFNNGGVGNSIKDNSSYVRCVRSDNPGSSSESESDYSGSDSGSNSDDNPDSDTDTSDSIGDSADSEPDNGDSTDDNDIADTGEFDPNSKGIWIDPQTYLIWENQMGNRTNELSHSDAILYCENLLLAGTDDWRLPTISELRTLVRGISTIETGGKCPTTDNCTAQDTCNNDTENTQGFGNSCLGCEALNTDKYDPSLSYLNLDEDCQLTQTQLDNNECYIVPAMYGDPCTGTWSSTRNTSTAGSMSNAYWYLNYKRGIIGSYADVLSGGKWVRCVRQGTASEIDK